MNLGTPQNLADSQRLISSSPDGNKYFCENFIEIYDRNQQPIKFKYNPAQEIIHQELTGRDVVVKASQLGITTFFLARYFKDTIMKPGTTSVIVAHEEFLTQRLLSRMNIMYERLPDVIYTDRGPIKMPKRQSDSAHHKTFPEIDSVFYIGTARAHVFGRGDVIHRFIGSEIAFWPEPRKILDPLMQRVPIGGQMILESTPNGEGNVFYEIVQEALEDQGRWNLIQLAWWLEPEYRIPLNSPYVKERHRGEIKDYTAEELAIVGVAGWEDQEADERIRWRRIKVEEIHHMFWQEFFEDIVSCFVTTSDPYYRREIVQSLRAHCYPHNSVIDLKGGGQAKVWEKPDAKIEFPRYVITVDPGQGLASMSVALVFRIIIEEGKISHKHCATLAGKYDPQTFAPMVMSLGYMYHTAKIASERNGHGLAFCAEIKDYPNLYRETDIISGVRGRVIGWKTTGAPREGSNGTKTFMMSALNDMLESLDLHDIDVVRQIANVRVGAEKQLVFMGGDDYHDAAAIFAGVSPTVSPMIQRGLAFAKDAWSRVRSA